MTKHNLSSLITRFGIIFLFIFSILIIYSCDGLYNGSSDSDDDSSDEAASITFTLEWPEILSVGSSTLVDKTAIDCSGLGIVTYDAEVWDMQGGGEILLTSAGPWNCIDGPTTIENVSPGSFRRVIVRARDNAENIIFRGEKWHLTVEDQEDESIQIILSQVLEDSGKSSHFSIATDSTDIPHICYYYQENINDTGVLKYLTWTGTEWSEGIIDSSLSGKADISIAIASNDSPHILYKAGTYLIYAFKDNDNWETEEIVNWQFGGSLNSSIALDSNNTPHCVAITSPFGGNKIEHFYREGPSNWTSEEVVTFGSTVTIFGHMRPSISFDSTDIPHVVYIWDDKLYYAYYDGMNWQLELVGEPDPSADNPYLGYPLISVNESGDPRVAYYENTSPSILRYAYEVTGNWIIESTETSGIPLLLLTNSINSLISYTIGNDGKFILTREGNWTTPGSLDILSPTGDSKISISMDDSGVFHLLHTNELDHLFFTKRQLSDW